MANRPHDTGAEAWGVQGAILSRLAPEKRLELAIDLSEGVRAIRLAGVRARDPGSRDAGGVSQIVAERPVRARFAEHSSLAAFFGSIVQVLDDAGIPHMLTGSLAAAFYAVPRATQDVDFVVDLQRSDIERLIQGLTTAGLYVSSDAALVALETEGQFNAIDPETGWKADLVIRKDRPFSAAEFTRRQRASLLGVDVAVTSLEDLIVAKLEWGQLADSELQRRDTASLLEAGWASIDRAYVESWVTALGLQTAWEQALARIGKAGSRSD